MNNLDLNIQFLCKKLNCDAPSFKESNQHTLKISDELSVILTLISKKNDLFIQAILIENLSREPGLKLRLFQTLLEKGSQVQKPEGGTLSFDKNESVLIFYKKLNLENVSPTFLLEKFPAFMEMVLFWKKIVKDFFKTPTENPSNLVKI